MKKLSLYIFLVLMWCNLSNSKDIVKIKGIEIKDRYFCEFVKGTGTKETPIFIIEEFPNKNFLLTEWTDYEWLSDNEWYDTIRLAKLKDEVLEWVYVGDGLLSLATFYTTKKSVKKSNKTDIRDYNQLVLEENTYILSSVQEVKLKFFQYRANKVKRTNKGSDKHIKLEENFFNKSINLINTGIEHGNRSISLCQLK